MKRQKRDPLQRAHSRGYNAALDGKAREACPYSNPDAREHWAVGWREARMSLEGSSLR